MESVIVTNTSTVQSKTTAPLLDKPGLYRVTPMIATQWVVQYIHLISSPRNSLLFSIQDRRPSKKFDREIVVAMEAVAAASKSIGSICCIINLSDSSRNRLFY